MVKTVIEFLVAEACMPKEIRTYLRSIYGSEIIDVSYIRRWIANIKKVNHGLLQIFDLAKSGYPKTAVADENVQRIDKLIRENRRITQHKIAEHAGISKKKKKKKSELHDQERTQASKNLNVTGSEDAHRRNKEKSIY